MPGSAVTKIGFWKKAATDFVARSQETMLWHLLCPLRNAVDFLLVISAPRPTVRRCSCKKNPLGNAL